MAGSNVPGTPERLQNPMLDALFKTVHCLGRAHQKGTKMLENEQNGGCK